MRFIFCGILLSSVGKMKKSLATFLINSIWTHKFLAILNSNNSNSNISHLIHECVNTPLYYNDKFVVYHIGFRIQFKFSANSRTYHNCYITNCYIIVINARLQWPTN